MDYGNLNSEIPIIEKISNGEMSDGFDETDHPDLTCLDLIQSHSQSASPLLQNFDLEDPITRENSHINGANSSNSYQETPLVSLPVSSLSQSTSISWNPQTFSKIQICKLEADANKISGNHNNIDSHQNDIEFLKKIVESLQKNNDTLQKNNDVFHKLLMK